MKTLRHAKASELYFPLLQAACWELILNKAKINSISFSLGIELTSSGTFRNIV